MFFFSSWIEFYFGLGGLLYWSFVLYFEKSFKVEWVQRGENLEGLGREEEYDENIFKVKTVLNNKI